MTRKTAPKRSGLDPKHAAILVQLLERKVPDFIHTLVASKDIESLATLSEALRAARGEGASKMALQVDDWRNICFATVCMLERPDPALQAFARQWLTDFWSTPAFALASLHAEVPKTFPGEFLIERKVALTKLAAPLALEAGRSLSSVFSRVIETALKQQAMHGLYRPDEAMVRTILEMSIDQPFQIQVRQSRVEHQGAALPVHVTEDVTTTSLLWRILQLPQLVAQDWLSLYSEVCVDSAWFRQEVKTAVAQLTVLDFDGAHLQPLLDGWLDDESAQAMFRYRVEPTGAPVPRALASLSISDADRALLALEAFRRHNVDLDEPCRFQSGLTLTHHGSMLHFAVGTGSPSFVAALLAAGCDPFQRMKAESGDELVDAGDAFTWAEAAQDTPRRTQILDLLKAYRARSSINQILDGIDAVHAAVSNDKQP